MLDWRGFGPVLGRPKAEDILRAGAGAGIALLVTGILLQLSGLGALIAPFGATAVLVFAVPNSPLAQPWSVVVGNTVSALVAITVHMVLSEAPWVAPVAVGFAIGAMIACRALHPPGGAVALLVSLAPLGGWDFTLSLVAAGSALLVVMGVIWNRAVGRVYPFRQPAQPGTHATQDQTAQSRIGLDPVELATILEDYRQSTNLGVADLARLVGAAEQAAAAHQLEGFTAADIMSRDLVTVGPDAPLGHVADLFRTHGFTSLPVVDDQGYQGLIFQIDLIRRAREDAFRDHSSLIVALTRLIGSHRMKPPKAGEIIGEAVASVTVSTPVGALLPLLADGGAEAVPVLDANQIVGIVTRTDLVSALAQRLARLQTA